MSKRILIVESDPEQSGEMRAALEARGFAVEETPNGKKSVELVRETRPNLVILSVELAAGQSGYVLCGKLKKDDELQSIPVVIVGQPDGFVQHSKLKTHADEYVPKPVDSDVLVERIAGLVGWPEPDAELTAADVVDDGEGTAPAEEISLDEATIQGDPDLDMLDSAFEGLTAVPDAAAEASEDPLEAPRKTGSEERVLEVEEFADAEAASEGNGPAPIQSLTTAAAPAVSALEVRALRAQLSSLNKSLSEAQSRQNDAEERVRELEAQLESRAAELEAIASRSGKGDKDFLVLREALNKKEKDILLLASDLKDKETEMVELRDHEVQLEQQVSEAAVELARRDAQIKALTGRTDQFAGDRKKLQEELNEARNRLQASESEAEEMRSMIAQLEASAQQAQDEIQQLRGEVHEMASQHEQRISKLYQRIRGEEKIRDKTKKALSIALHLLEEQSTADEEDEPAAA